MTNNKQPVISANNLKKYYLVEQGGFFKKNINLKALDGASFFIEAGKTLAVVGESGCGKSTLARLITMIEEPTSGGFSISGINAVTCGKSDKKKLRSRVQIVFQDPYGSLNPRKKVGAILEEPLIINSNLTSSQRREKSLAIMEKVGLTPEQYNRYPHMFSGGQRQRIAIARALMLNPDLVIADEPVSALDVSVQAQALNLLMDLQEEMNLAYLFISHDLSVVRLIAHEIMVMYLGRVVEQGEKNTIFDNPLHPYTMALLAATPRVNADSRQKKIRLSGELPSPLNPPSGCTFHKRCAYITDICKEIVPEPRQ
ncbi:oligopeptide/dipeptide ABC transporter, ATP-binding, partial [Candidatus Magnetoovum chiemensis]